jgi:hypothetical protein
MTGGLFKSASRVALVAVAGVLIGSMPAKAADLGGDCCADLEERVAELETTTVRKGNRRVSLTISGQVNRAIMYWNDGGRSNTYFGLDNTNTSTRINFAGSGRISPTVTAGFNILMEINGGGRTATVNQLDEDEPAGTIGGNQDHRIGIRDANWWLESSQLGRVTVGRLTPPGIATTIDIGGIGVVAPGTSLAGNALRFRQTDGTLLGATRTIGAFWDNGADTNKRVEGLRYTSPNFAGFTFGASIGEAAKIERTAAELVAGGPIGRSYAYQLTYAGEFSGVRIAAAIGQEVNKAKEQIGIGATAANPSDGKATSASLSLRHVPTGLFAQGYLMTLQRTDYTNITTVRDTDKSRQWGIQAGISQNWFGIGATALYGEYFRINNGVATNVVAAADDATTSRMRVWGLGIVQNIDAAAMELYLGYRNHSAEVSTSAGGIKDIDVVLGGARIRF